MKRVQPRLETHSDNLLQLLGEELKQSLVSIAQLSEIKHDQQAIATHARGALQTIDNVLLYQRINSGQTQLALEPIHIGSTIHAVAQQMEPMMRAAGCRTELHIQHSLHPVDADRRLLESALRSLWLGLLSNMTEPTEIICHAHTTPRGIRVSLHCADESLKDISLAEKNERSSQPFSAIAGSATDLLVAQGLFSLLGTQLNKSARSRLQGLGATLQISRQLQLVG